ncbi:hypothetical protein [Sporosarcina koreensis]|uniref:hypothetical protein n=1 Tax=Sporosarcina koreensis TaxID=334735 RepID=UPI00075F454B|nr:hypothetical protein [Sporosarcina koreensis]
MYNFTIGTHNEQLNAYIDDLWAQEKWEKALGIAGVGGSKRYEYAEQRRKNVELITESFYATVGQMPSPAQLDRLASFLLFDELSDPHPDKMTREEYPIMSDSQRDERLGDEVSFKWTESVAVDGRDYQPKTRDYMRKLREIGR